MVQQGKATQWFQHLFDLKILIALELPHLGCLDYNASKKKQVEVLTPVITSDEQFIQNYHHYTLIYIPLYHLHNKAWPCMGCSKPLILDFDYDYVYEQMEQ